MARISFKLARGTYPIRFIFCWCSRQALEGTEYEYVNAVDPCALVWCPSTDLLIIVLNWFYTMAAVVSSFSGS